MRRQLPLATTRALGELRSLQHIATQQLKRDTYLTTCSKGCSYCCYYPVALTPLEGLLLFRWLEGRIPWTTQLRAKLEEHHQKVWKQSLEVWLLSQIPCPFLVNPNPTDQVAHSVCSIYSGRPFMCRTTVSRKDPELCHPHLFYGSRSDSIPLQKRDMMIHLKKLSKEARVPLASLPLSTAVLLGSRMFDDDDGGISYLEELLDD